MIRSSTRLSSGGLASGYAFLLQSIGNAEKFAAGTLAADTPGVAALDERTLSLTLPHRAR